MGYKRAETLVRERWRLIPRQANMYATLECRCQRVNRNTIIDLYTTHLIHIEATLSWNAHCLCLDIGGGHPVVITTGIRTYYHHS